MSWLALIHDGGGSMVEGAEAQAVLGPFPTQQDARQAGDAFCQKVPAWCRDWWWHTQLEIPSTPADPDVLLDQLFNNKSEFRTPMDAKAALDELVRESEALGLYDDEDDEELPEHYRSALDELVQRSEEARSAGGLYDEEDERDWMEGDEEDDESEDVPVKETPEWLKEQDKRPEHFRSASELFKNFGFN